MTAGTWFRLVVVLTLLTLTATPERCIALEPVRPGQDASISRIAFADGKLWLLTDAGALSTLTEEGERPVVVATPDAAFDLWEADGQAVIITGQRNGGEYWTISRWNQRKWQDVARIATLDEDFMGLSKDGPGVTVLTTHRLIEIQGTTQNTVELATPKVSGHAGFMPPMSLLATPTAVFYGINMGEFGGGLHRVDRKTGVITAVEGSGKGRYCTLPLDSHCDPVTGLAIEPWKPTCLAIAVGLVHMLSTGRILEVCGQTPKTLYSKALPSQPSKNSADQGDFAPTVPFFGLIAADQSLWAVGTDGIYEIGADGSAVSMPLPAFKKFGRISVSFELPHLVLVMTDINQRDSLSGSVPIMVAR